MIPKLSDYLSPTDILLTWNDNWLSDFESPWSIFEKIKYANDATKKDIFELFAKTEVLKKRSILGTKNHDLYLLSAFEEQRFIQLLGFSLKSYNKYILEQMSGFLPNGTFIELKKDVCENHYWRRSLTICLECMKDGYHSILHQFALIYHCPFHNSPLIENCPECDVKIPYEISDRFMSSPYICSCGYRYKELQQNAPFTALWKKYSFEDIIDPKINTWIRLNLDEQEKFKRVYFYEYSNITKNTLLLDFLLGIGKLDSNLQANLKSVSSSSNIQHIKNPSIMKTDIKTRPSNLYPVHNRFDLEDIHNPLVKNIMKELIEIKVKTIQSIGKKLMNNFLFAHRSCIHRYTNVYRIPGSSERPICPFAFAYAKWKQSLLKLDYYYDVDNKPTNKLTHNIQSIAFTYDPDKDLLIDLVNNLLLNMPVTNPQCYTHIKWVISHVIGHVCLNNFYNWLSQAASISNHEVDERKTDNLLAVLYPKHNSESIHIIWDDNTNISELINNINCPFPTKKTRKIQPNEVSHHPLRQAIRNM
ncbi:hypothetical protein ABN764_04525 [Paenibacillaceae sp. P-4]|uniref:hypothetical protein n=1 Tax=Paenibacillaceae bacterium P-4 TaxID=3160969 RepID=UPI0032E81EF7